MKRLSLILLFTILLSASANAGTNSITINNVTYHVGDTIQLADYTGLDAYQFAWLKVGYGLTPMISDAIKKYHISKDHQGKKFIIQKIRKKQKVLLVKNPSLGFDVLIDIVNAQENEEINFLPKDSKSSNPNI